MAANDTPYIENRYVFVFLAAWLNFQLQPVSHSLSHKRLELGAKQSDDSSEAESESVRDVRDARLMRNAVTFDDGRSDAATVGRTVVAACQQENAAIVAALAGPDGFRQGEIRRQIEQNSQEAATQYVLSHRAAVSVRR